MSSFTKNLSIEPISKKLWRVNKAFEYHVGSENSGEVIQVPEGYETDGISIPRFCWVIVGHPLSGEAVQASVIHDFLYQYGLYDQKRSDEIFLEALIVLKVSVWKRQIMFQALRMFGFVAWNNARKNDKKDIEMAARTPNP